MAVYHLAAVCLFGLEKFVGEEIDEIGGVRTGTIDGRVFFDGDETVIAKANIHLRTAERVLIELARFHAETFTELFDGVKAVPLEDFIGKRDSFPVKGHSIRSKLFSIPDCQSIIKKAMVERLKKVYRTDWFEESGTKLQFEFLILNDEVSLMLDTSGVTLHKRGYRTEAGEAPLRETLACALVKIARMRENVRLWDPFCGSGTIVLEAALLMTNTAPGLYRHFAAERYGFLADDLFGKAREEALSSIRADTAFRAVGTDNDRSVLKTAEANAARAKMGRFVSFHAADARDLASDGIRTTIVTNPPYGERLETIKDARLLYRAIGKNFPGLSPWQIYILTSEEEFESLYGQKADKVRKLYNGMIPCRFYQYYKQNNRD